MAPDIDEGLTALFRVHAIIDDQAKFRQVFEEIWPMFAYAYNVAGFGDARAVFLMQQAQSERCEELQRIYARAIQHQNVSLMIKVVVGCVAIYLQKRGRMPPGDVIPEVTADILQIDPEDARQLWRRVDPIKKFQAEWVRLCEARGLDHVLTETFQRLTERAS